MDKRESVVLRKAYALAVNIVHTYKDLIGDKKEYVLSKQLLKSGTSVGANITEANGGISRKDFSAKMSIAYKESLETKYWLQLLNDTGYLEKKTFSNLYDSTDKLSRMLFSILKTTRKVTASIERTVP